MANTSIINRIAIHATAETSLPTLPASTGSSVSKADWTTAGFETIGSRNLRSDNYDVNESSFNWNVEERLHETSAPISDGVDEVIQLGRRLVDIEISLYEMDGALLTLGSDIDFTSSVATWDSALTARTVAIEVTDLGIFEFPKSMVRFTNIEMGMVEDQVASCTMVIKPLNVSGKPGGWSYEEY